MANWRANKTFSGTVSPPVSIVIFKLLGWITFENETGDEKVRGCVILTFKYAEM